MLHDTTNSVKSNHGLLAKNRDTRVGFLGKIAPPVTEGQPSKDTIIRASRGNFGHIDFQK